MMLISESSDCRRVAVSSRCLWLVSLRHVLQVVIDLPENKKKNVQPNRTEQNPFSSDQCDTFCSTGEMLSQRYYTPSELPISHSRMKCSASETVCEAVSDRSSWTPSRATVTARPSVARCPGSPGPPKTQQSNCTCAAWMWIGVIFQVMQHQSCVAEASAQTLSTVNCDGGTDVKVRNKRPAVWICCRIWSCMFSFQTIKLVTFWIVGPLWLSYCSAAVADVLLHLLPFPSNNSCTQLTVYLAPLAKTDEV